MNNLLTAHMLVKNEENWVWYALKSVLPFVDKIIIFDTGSTDNTRNIIQLIKSNKIHFQEKGNADRKGLVALRNEMLSLTKTPWFMLLDADEIWPFSSIKKLKEEINKTSSDIWGMVVRTKNCVVDVWHFQPENAGKYRLLGKQGHFTIRAYRKLSGFQWLGEYPNEAYSDEQGQAINHFQDHLSFLDIAYWHTTHLHRSSRDTEVVDRQKKYKLEKGIAASRDELPEIFFVEHPRLVPSPWIKPSFIESLLAFTLTPLRRLKRLFVI